MGGDKGKCVLCSRYETEEKVDGKKYRWMGREKRSWRERKVDRREGRREERRKKKDESGREETFPHR